MRNVNHGTFINALIETHAVVDSHVEYEYFFDAYKHIFYDLHTNMKQGCNEFVIPPNASRDFIANIMCPRHEGKNILWKIMSIWELFQVQWVFSFEPLHSWNR